MNRLEAWALHLSTILLTLTGVAYATMRYLMKPADPFSVVNHPLEPYMMPPHILSAPVLILGLGSIIHSHILFKYQNNSRTGRRSGLTLIPLFVVMVSSGYLLQIIHETGRNLLVWLHLVSGLLWFFGYAAHYVSSFRLRRMMAKQNEINNGEESKVRSTWNRIRPNASAS